MRKELIAAAVVVLLCGCATRQSNVRDNSEWVDVMIGSGGHGHVFVGASVPHGMVQLGPNNMSHGWEWCSGYHDSDSTIIGFAHTHLSGTGIADMGDLLFMPLHSFNMARDTMPQPCDYYSTFDQDEVIAEPGYFLAVLNRYEIEAELTAGERTGWHRYGYPYDCVPQLLIDMDESARSLSGRKGTMEAWVRMVNDSTLCGYRRSDEWARNHEVYFYTVFSSPITSMQEYRDGDRLRVILEFDSCRRALIARTGISYTGIEGAQRNLEAESAGKDFDAVREDAAGKWRQALSCIDFDTAQDSVRTIFYTALYHSMIAPSLFCDVDGNYRGADGAMHQAAGFIPHTIFSLWDTYRAVNPLYTMIDGSVAEYVNSLLDIYERQGTLPMWHLAGNETNCMVGYHSIPVIVDACLKGIPGIDAERAYSAVSSIAAMTERGLNYVDTLGYIPADKMMWSVARGLEYAIDDYAVAMLAQHLGKESEYARFMERASNYKHYFDPATRFMRGLNSDGSRAAEFNPSHSLHLQDDYVEGNAWQYTWLVPHDVDGLMKLLGGKERFVAKLDSLFSASEELNEGASADITGMIGQYAHGNEPSHHIIYLYALAGEQHKAAKLLRRVCSDFYTTSPAGLIGNEDCGQMSAWYIFTALGFYPVNPVNGSFVIGSPLCNHAQLRLNNGNSLEIRVQNYSPENIYVQSVSLNGTPISGCELSYSALMQGGTLEFHMAPTPSL